MIEVEVLNRKEMVNISTSDPEMNTARMSVYMEYITIYCSSEIGIELPDLETHKIVEMYEYYREKGML